MVGWHHGLNGHGLNKPQEMVGTGKSALLQSMESQRVGHDWATELN